MGIDTEVTPEPLVAVGCLAPYSAVWLRDKGVVVFDQGLTAEQRSESARRLGIRL